MKRTQYEFELDREYKKERQDNLESNDPMEHKMKFGKFKGIPLHEIMKTQSGRRYLNWVSTLEVEDEFKDMQLELKIKILECFDIYNDYVQEKKTHEVKKEKNAKRAKTTPV